MFKVGQKVVCVDASPDPFGRALQVKKGQVYTVSAVLCGGIGITLVEISCTDAHGWWASRFRPVVERKTDISVFQAMLKQVPVTADLTLAHTSAERGGAA